MLGLYLYIFSIYGWKEELMNTAGLKSGFLARMHSPLQMQELFNHLPDVYFFVKDREGRFVMANHTFCASMRC